MKTAFRITVSLCVLSLLAVVACETMLQPSSGGGGSSGGGTVSVAGGDESTAIEGGGFFADVGGDGGEVPDAPPDEVEVEEEGEETASHFRAIQIDPVNEDSAGPKFVKAFDIDNDDLMDLVTAW
ncbi:MAG: hypothetical protein ACYSVY_17840, partial [Planctomycetota bacterium]